MLSDMLWFGVLQTSAVVAATHLGHRIATDRPRWARLLAAAQAYLFLAFASTGGLAAIGQLTRPALLVVVGGIAALARLTAGKAGGHRIGLGDLRAAIRGRPLEAATIFSLAAYWGVRATLLGNSLAIDDLAYHATNVASWAGSRSLTPTSFNVQAFFPSTCEILSLWFLVSLGSDAYASLTGLLISWLLALTLYGLTRTAVDRPVAPFLSCALAFSSWQLSWASFNFSAVDLGGPTFLLMALLAIVASPRPRENDWALARRSLLLGALLGLAVGSKVSLVLGAFVLVALHAIAVARTVSVTAAAATLVPIAVAAVATGGYWYVRNLLVTGNPLYPAETGLFEGPWSREFLGNTSIIGHLKVWGSPSFIISMIRYLLEWPLPLGLVAIGGYFVGVWLVAKHARWLPQGGLLTAVGLLALGAIMMVAFPTMPFSAGNEVSFAKGFFMGSGVRYILLVYLCGVQLAAISILAHPAGGGWRQPLCDCLFTTSLLLFALFPAGDQTDRAEVHVLRFAIVGGWLTAWLLQLPARWVAVLQNMPLGRITVFSVVLLSAYAPIKQRFVDQKYYNDPVLGELCQFLETLPPGTTIAYAGREVPQLPYPLFGRRQRLQPIAIEKDGRPRPMLATAGEVEQRRRSDPPACGAYLEALRDAGVEVFVTLRRDKHADWPVVHGCLADQAGAAVFQCGTATVWRLASESR